MCTLITSLSPLQDIFKNCTDDGVTLVTELPYFEGDFWPNVLEEFIKELDQEAREREASELASEVRIFSPLVVGFCLQPLK